MINKCDIDQLLEKMHMIYEQEKEALIKEALQQFFVYKIPHSGQIDIMTDIRKQAYAFASYLMHNVPDSFELSQSIHYLDLCVMQANASLMRHEMI